MNDERLAVLHSLEGDLAVAFRDISLLDNALTHSSFANENQPLSCRDNERMEFMGDAVLGLCISDMLMEAFPRYREGPLSKLRASLVNEQTLAGLARKLSLGRYLLLGRGEEASGGREKNSLLADALEAVIAAVYMDSGFEAALNFVRRIFPPLIDAAGGIDGRDFKTALQETVQSRFRETPRYLTILESGPDHDKVFEVELTIGGVIRTVGTGKSKKEAEHRAAERALAQLNGESPKTP